jgi:predicted ATPase
VRQGQAPDAAGWDETRLRLLYIDLLASLLDKSIVYRLADSGEPRFAMLTMIGDYALDRLREAGGLDAAMERLAAFHLGLVRNAEVGLRSVDQRTWRRVLDFEVDNVRATLAWLADRKRVAELALLLRGCWLYWWLRGHFDECRGWLRGVLETGGRVESEDYGWVVAVDVSSPSSRVTSRRRSRSSRPPPCRCVPSTTGWASP